jgi:hypothetical protein
VARVAGPLFLLTLGATLTGASVALILYGPANYIIASLGMLSCGLFSASYALTFVVAGYGLSPEYTGAAFRFTNMAIIAVGGLCLQPLIGFLALMRGHQVPDAASLSVLIWAQAAALVLLLPLIRGARK